MQPISAQHLTIGICSTGLLVFVLGYYKGWSNLALIATLQTAAILALSLHFLANGKPDTPAKKATAPEKKAAASQKAPSTDQPQFSGPDRLIENFGGLKDRLVELTDEVKEPAGEGPTFKWNPVLERKRGDYTCRVEKRAGGDFFFRVICDFESTPEEAFDYLSDIDGRHKWDELTETSGTVEQVSHKSAIVYMRSKGIWPTAARDCIVMSFISRLEDGRFCNVTQSVDNHPNYQDRPGSVRMTAKLAGLIISPHKSNPKMCHCVQIIDGDLGGWLPPSIVSLVSTQAFPLSMGRVNAFLSKVENPRTVSTLIEASEGKGVVASKPPLSSKPAPTAGKKAAARPAENSWVITAMNMLKESQPVLVLIILLLILRIRR